MPTQDMKITNPRRETGPYVVPDFAGPVIRGDGDTNFTCQRCKTVLLEGVVGSDVKGIAVQCGKCGSVNTIPDGPTGQTSAAAKSNLAPVAQRKRKKISVVTPCYNEEDNVHDVYNAVKTLFDGPLAGYEREHVFADNASTDRTAKLLREIAGQDPCVKVILNSRNFGGARSGFNAIMSTTGDATLLFLPADMQDPPSLLPLFVKLWEQGNEIVYGVRATRSEGFIMKTLRRSYYRLISAASSLKVPPDVGDYQVVDRQVIEAMRKTNDAYPYARMMTFEAGFRAIGVKYHWGERQKGFSKNRFFHLVDDGLNGLVTFTTVPMRLCLYAGTLIALSSVIYAIATFFGSILQGSMAPPGIPTLIVALFFFSGVQLFFLGVLGEYILAIYAQVRSRPMVVERERINYD